MGGSSSVRRKTPEVVEAVPVASPVIVADQPVAALPVAAQPVAALPVAAQPVDAQPVAALPVADQPVAAQPVAAQPVAALRVAQPAAQNGYITQHPSPVIFAARHVAAQPARPVDSHVGSNEATVANTANSTQRSANTATTNSIEWLCVPTNRSRTTIDMTLKELDLQITM